MSNAGTRFFSGAASGNFFSVLRFACSGDITRRLFNTEAGLVSLSMTFGRI